MCFSIEIKTDKIINLFPSLWKKKKKKREIFIVLWIFTLSIRKDNPALHPFDVEQRY